MKRHLGYGQFFTRGRLCFPALAADAGCLHSAGPSLTEMSRRWMEKGKSKAMEKLRLVFVYKHEEKRRSAAHRNSCNY